MLNLELLAPAWRELDAIADIHLQLVGAASAERITDDILDTLELLKTNPKLGKKCEDNELREKGYRIIYTPYAVTRADSDDRIYMELGRNMPGYEEACARFREKWKKVLEAGDPMYNPTLSTRTGNYHVKRRAT